MGKLKILMVLRTALLNVTWHGERTGQLVRSPVPNFTFIRAKNNFWTTE